MYSSARERLLGNKFDIAVHVFTALAFTKPVAMFFGGSLNSASDSPRLGNPLADYLEVID
jgi:hypothetical protein